MAAPSIGWSRSATSSTRLNRRRCDHAASLPHRRACDDRRVQTCLGATSMSSRKPVQRGGRVADRRRSSDQPVGDSIALKIPVQPGGGILVGLRVTDEGKISRQLGCHTSPIPLDHRTAHSGLINPAAIHARGAHRRQSPRPSSDLTVQHASDLPNRSFVRSPA